jgi:hypothetical protein
MADAQHGWWFPRSSAAEPELFGVFESNANMLCPDDLTEILYQRK